MQLVIVTGKQELLFTQETGMSHIPSPPSLISSFVIIIFAALSFLTIFYLPLLCHFFSPLDELIPVLYVVMHRGTGAFGGNREFMTIVQLAAALAAG